MKPRFRIILRLAFLCLFRTNVRPGKPSLS